jgi:enterochelin esterase-like enzyme/sugar lactone lactonase YvrE
MDKRKLYCLATFFFSLLNFLQAETLGTVSQGKIEEFIFKDSKIYPGTERIVNVYIPTQINPKIPACVYIQQDGMKPTSAGVLDTLIAKKVIPVMVGIFIRPGNVPPLNENTIFRQNRCFEYNSLGDRYARFVLEEIIPYVQDKYKLNLSQSGNDRCIGGVSSGGIAAFNAAWERPDAFSRVYCASGSFVAFRGGNIFPTLVRKTEAKPIRAFLTAATNDMENCAGDWTLINLEMDKALKFSGYDYRFKMIEGKHGAGYNENLGEAMTYLWNDWPNPIKAGESAPRVRDIIIPGESWNLVSENFVHTKSPVCNQKGEVFFIDKNKNQICKISNNLKITTFIENADDCDGITVGTKDELFTVSQKTGRINSYNSKGEKTLFAKNVFGDYILAMRDGAFYVDGSVGNNEGAVYLIEKNKVVLVDKDNWEPSGLAISPDKWLLAVADRHSHNIYSFTISEDGKLHNKEPYFWLHVPDKFTNSHIESICYDREGHLYAATNYGVQVCAWDGPNQVILPLPNNEQATGLCIGGTDLDVLFVFCKDKIYARKIKNHATGVFAPWIKRTRGKL